MPVHERQCMVVPPSPHGSRGGLLKCLRSLVGTYHAVVLFRERSKRSLRSASLSSPPACNKQPLSAKGLASAHGCNTRAMDRLHSCPGRGGHATATPPDARLSLAPPKALPHRTPRPKLQEQGALSHCQAQGAPPRTSGTKRNNDLNYGAILPLSASTPT